MASEYGGLELFFTFDYDPLVEREVGVFTDVSAVEAFSSSDSPYGNYKLVLKIIKNTSDQVFLEAVSYISDEVVDRSDYKICDSDSDLDELDVRVFIANEIASVYASGKWVYSVIMRDTIYQDDGYVDASIVAIVGNVDVNSIRRVELGDRREAVWVDYEATTYSAIRSVLQQRPVEVFAHQDRMINFTYIVGKETLLAHFVRKFYQKEVSSQRASIDGLVYGAEVEISTFESAARDIGFSTRLYRLSELDYGTKKAARIMQEKEWESLYPAGAEGRFDPRIEITDLMRVQKTVSGTGREVDNTFVAENISFSIVDGNNSMRVKGREDK